MGFQSLMEAHPSQHVSITHEGVKERELAIEGHETEHFELPVVQYVVQTFQGPVTGAVQVAAGNATAKVNARSSVPAGELARLVVQLREQEASLPSEVRAIAALQVERLEQQAKAPTPNIEVIKTSVEVLKLIPQYAPLLGAAAHWLSSLGM